MSKPIEQWTEIEETKYTPGPWKATLDPESNLFYIQTDNRLSADIASVYPIRHRTQHNARVLAAAPRLLCALRRLSGGLRMDAEGHADGCGCVACEALAAIPEAEGGGR